MVSYMIGKRGSPEAASRYQLSGVWGGQLDRFSFRVDDADSSNFIGIALGRVTLAYLGRNLGEKTFSILLLASASGCLGVVWGVRSVPVDAVALVLVGFFIGPVTPKVLSAVSTRVPPSLKSSVVSLTIGLGLIGSSVGPLIFGVVAGKGGLASLPAVLIGASVFTSSTVTEHGIQQLLTGEDGTNDEILVAKLLNISTTEGGAPFLGPLEFLNTYVYQLGLSLLVPSGSAMEYQSAADFWNTRGRLLFNATAGQAYYNATYQNGSSRPTLVLRTTSQARILASEQAWAAGFFGPTNTSAQYDLVEIKEGGGANDTLALDCVNSDVAAIGYTGDDAVFEFIPLYLQEATERMNNYLVNGAISFNVNDTYAMQSICTYEYATFGDSEFCYLFTEQEWAGFEYSLDLEYYYDFSFGQATGRAQGIGYVEEMIARLKGKPVAATNTNVNKTIDDDPAKFPIGEKLYMDMSHDDVQVSVITALGVKYFQGELPITASAPSPSRPFRISYMTPFASRLNTEVIGCTSASPLELKKNKVLYSPNQNGYDPALATNKFIRMTWNGGVVPLATIEGEYNDSTLSCLLLTEHCHRWSVRRSYRRIVSLVCLLVFTVYFQVNASITANYDYACTGNYTLDGFVADSGTIFPIV
ncbi:hypothetical protein P7C70_g1287, partial [Phenoliferia sp. Uapishka_3]